VEVGVEDYLKSLGEGLPPWDLARSSEALFFTQRSVKGPFAGSRKGAPKIAEAGLKKDILCYERPGFKSRSRQLCLRYEAATTSERPEIVNLQGNKNM
jgi:hypothetical protein